MIILQVKKKRKKYLKKVKQDNKIEYKVNIDHPLYETLRKVVLKHLGLEDLVEAVLERMGNVENILLIGDYAKGIDSGNIEVFLVGKDLNFNYISKLEDKIENLIGRKVSFYLSSSLPTNQFHIKLYSSD